MYTIHITAETMAELRQKVANLALDFGYQLSLEYVVTGRGGTGGDGTTVTVEVPLPEPRAEDPAPEKPKRRGRPPKNPEPEEQMHAAAEPLKVPDPSLTEGVEPLRDEDIPEHMRDDQGPASVEEAQAESRPTETGSAPTAEPEPDTSETATSASDDGASQAEDSGPSTPEDEEELPADFLAFIETVENATDWSEIPAAMRSFYNTSVFREMDPDAQNRVRRNTYAVCAERAELRELTNEGGVVLRNEDGSPKMGRLLQNMPDHADDPTLFRMWLEDQSDPDAIRGTLAVLKRGELWARTPEQAHAVIDRAVEARLAALGA